MTECRDLRHMRYCRGARDSALVFAVRSLSKTGLSMAFFFISIVANRQRLDLRYNGGGRGDRTPFPMLEFPLIERVLAAS